VEALLIQSDSNCPSPPAVLEEVRELTTPEQRAAAASDARVVISDRGDSLAIALTRDGQTTVRVYQDAARDCARRAHFVSVLTVVSLLPNAVASPEPEPEPAPKPKPEPKPEPQPERKARPVPPAPSPHSVRIELAGSADFSVPISDTVRALSPGALLRVALGAGSLRLTLSTEYSPPLDVDFTGASAGRAELQRFDVGAGARLVLGHQPVYTSVELGVLAERAQLSGLSAQTPSQDTAFSLGGRAGIHLGFGEQRALSPFLGAHAKLFPFAPGLAQLPQGEVGHLPYVWLGVSAGLALGL
jgi:hypothetical protein